MSDSPFEGLIGSQTRRQRRGYGATASGLRKRATPTGQEYMFLEDVRLHTLPYSMRSDDGFEAKVVTDRPEIADLVSDALPTGTYRHRRLEDSLRDYMGSAVRLLSQDDLFLEIEYFWPPEEVTGTPTAFRIEFLEPQLVTRHLGIYRYLVPPQPNIEGELPWANEKLRSASLVVVSLPRRLRRDLNRTLRAIRAADQNLAAMHNFTIGRYGANSGFDFTGFQRESRDIVLRASAATGWSGRGNYTDGLLDPEKAWRAIQFEQLVVMLRDIALAGLQEAIDRAGTKMGFTAQIELAEVLSLAELEGMRRDLKAGTRPMSELLSPRHSRSSTAP